MISASKIIALANGQIGTKENPAGSNKVKYNTAYYGRAVSGSAYAWCCVFIWWLFDQLGANNLFYGGGKTASCTTLMNYAKKNGLWVTSGYKPGDLILYNWAGKKHEAEHVGICVSTNAGYVICIEGNTAIGNDGNGGAVMQRTRSLSVVVGAYRPKYTVASKTTLGASKEAEKVNISVYVLKQGSKGSPVKKLQILLNGLGHNCGTVDGSFGPKTLSAVKAFQTASGLPVDGSVGPATWAKLLG
jgi:hypothetical protein